MTTGWFNGEREYYATAAMGGAGDAPPPPEMRVTGDNLTEFERDLCRQAGIDPQDFTKLKTERDAAAI